MNNEIYGHLEVKIENDRGRKKKKNSRVETTICRVSGRLNFHWVDLNKPLRRVSLGLLMSGVVMVHVVDSYEFFQLFKFKLCTMH